MICKVTTVISNLKTEISVSYINIKVLPTVLAQSKPATKEGNTDWELLESC